MDKQLLKRFSSEKAAKELSRVADTVTCLECCKFYIVPETAICGHTLCHGCWIGRQICPVCALPVKRRALKQNAVIKRYTECVQKATTLFEKQFNIRMEEFAPDPPVETVNKVVEKDPSKTVNAWLCDSQNQFSAPVSTQLSTQADSPAVEVKTCEIQVHGESKKVPSPTKVVHAQPPPQDDWDKIESVSDTEEFLLNKENFGPNIDPCHLDDDEYTTDHPRRSSRKREHKNEPKPSETSGDKHSSSNISIDNTDKLNKIKQNWSNVKKMRKEFSKLHKKNKNKLNVSIEMCKKTKSAISNPTPSVEPESQKVIIIDDCTPKIDTKEKSPVCDKIAIDTNCQHDAQVINISPRNVSPKENHSQEGTTNHDNENISKRDHRVNSSSILNHFKDVTDNENKKPVEAEEVNSMSRNIPFLKKSALQIDDPADLKSNQKNTEIIKESTVHTVNHAVNNNVETDSDDIQITIKIGTTLTNIFIKKKKSDVNVKLHTDQEAQTLQCMEKATSCNTSSSSSSKIVDVQNIEINIGGEGVVSAVTQQTKSIEATTIQPPTTTTTTTTTTVKTNLNKTVSTKKDTASAETVPVEISASLEKELSKIMECDADGDKDNEKNKTQNIPQDKPEDVHKVSLTYTASNKEKSEEMELDEDMFASGSVQENNVQLLKATKPAPSEIIMPTLRQRKQTQTQASNKKNRQADKRNRENDDVMTSNKKIKTSEIYDHSIDDVHNEDNKDESSINYDSVMGQVFASIDADIVKGNKSQSIIESNQDKTLVDKKDATPATQHSQLLKTQKTQRKVLGLSRLGTATQNIKSNLPPKDSESLFALSNVESQILTEKGHHQKHGPETQAHIENLLTPGMCQDLAGSHRSLDAGRSQEIVQQEVIPATPQDREDSDASVCEETPQKASPFARKSNQAGTQPKQPQLPPNEAQLIKEIINISDTDKDIVAKPKLTLATPTINQFCNSIQHNSTPVARKSLDFGAEKTSDQFTKPQAPLKYCVAASCLTSAEVKTVELLCARRGWTFVKEFTKDLTHLVVGVDEEGRSQRTVKFMCALAAGRWIVRYEWADTWLRRGQAAEEPFEALDWTGEPGPRRARTAGRKLFHGCTFFCMPPFSVLSEPVLKVMLESAGGRVVASAREVQVKGEDVRLLLAEPEHTQENQFTYLALELNIVPVNYEWALNCLGSYTLTSILDLMLCPSSLLPAVTSRWPAVLITQEFDTVTESD